MKSKSMTRSQFAALSPSDRLAWLRDEQPARISEALADRELLAAILQTLACAALAGH